MSSETPIKLGFVGLSARGWAASAHVPSLAHASLRSTFTLSAIQTSSPASAAAAKETYAKSWPPLDGAEVKTYHGNDATDIANDLDVDVVAVSVKAPDHKAIIDKAIAAGKHIFVEYPPGKTLAESEQMRADVMKNGKIQVLVGLQSVHSAALRKVKKIIDSGRIGKVISTTVIGNVPRETRIWAPEAADNQIYALDKANGVTVLSIVGGHQLGSLIHVLGPFASVSAISSQHYPNIDIFSSEDPTKVIRSVKSNTPDHYSFAGALKSGAHVSVTWKTGYKTTPGRQQLLWLIDGEEGSVKFEAEEGVHGKSLMNISDPTSVTVNGQPVDEYIKAEGIEWVEDPAFVVEEHEKGTFFEFTRREWLEFSKSLRGGKGEFATLDDAIEVQKVVDAVERSAELGGLGIRLI
ncbi:oxidoreductase [Ephemerocybe angulata]|uniref:Oxidoreductase n=1 Tax=Ephemerocybe angulata TaxID=980116 RepID=A0A8H6M283_9AGAR|nr:oxidoreductase [Tulosesus angulatus]